MKRSVLYTILMGIVILFAASCNDHMTENKKNEGKPDLIVYYIFINDTESDCRIKWSQQIYERIHINEISILSHDHYTVTDTETTGLYMAQEATFSFADGNQMDMKLKSIAGGINWWDMLPNSVNELLTNKPYIEIRVFHLSDVIAAAQNQ